MDGKSLAPKQIMAFKFYTASRILVADWWNSDVSYDIGKYLRETYMGIKYPHHLIRRIYFAFTHNLHPKTEACMDCDTHIYGIMCHYKKK
jgi:hypothetical protein